MRRRLSLVTAVVALLTVSAATASITTPNLSMLDVTPNGFTAHLSDRHWGFRSCTGQATYPDGGLRGTSDAGNYDDLGRDWTIRIVDPEQDVGGDGVMPSSITLSCRIYGPVVKTRTTYYWYSAKDVKPARKMWRRSGDCVFLNASASSITIDCRGASGESVEWRDSIYEKWVHLKRCDLFYSRLSSTTRPKPSCRFVRATKAQRRADPSLRGFGYAGVQVGAGKVLTVTKVVFRLRVRGAISHQRRAHATVAATYPPSP
jgi:hypothetical protein